MPKFFVYANEADYAADKWTVSSYLGLALTQANAVKSGHTIIHRTHDGKVWRWVDGKWS